MKIIDHYLDESYTGGEIVSLSEAKASLLVDFVDDDALITAMIVKARSAVENYCHVSLVPKSITVTLALDKPVYDRSFPVSKWDRAFFGVGMPTLDWFELPYGPVTSITSVTAMSDDGQYVSVLQAPTIGSIGAQPGYMTRGPLKSFVQIRPIAYADQLIVQYNACYIQVPPGLKQCILTEVNNLYFQRGNPQADLSEKTKVQCNPFVRQWQ